MRVKYLHRITLPIAVYGICGLNSHAGYAQNRSTSQDNELLLMGEQTVVTASKKAQKVSEAPAAVTVITAEQIRASGAPTLIDILRYVPGVDVTEPNRAVPNVGVRGFTSSFSNKLLVMIDGRSIYDDFYGTVWWHVQPILLSRIKRIEIVRGPGSALYGANAFNGVINIITKTPSELAAEAKLSLFSLFGEQNTQFTEIQTAEKGRDGFNYALGGAYNHTGGFGAGKPGSAADGYTVPIFTVDAEKHVKRATFAFTLNSTDAASDYNIEGLSLMNAQWHTTYANLDYRETETKNPISAHVYGNLFLVTEPGGHILDRQTYDFEIQQSRRISAHQSIIYGANYRSIQATSFFTGPQGHYEGLKSAYLQDDARLSSRTHLFAGLRLDSNSLYGTLLTPRVSVVHRMQRSQSVRLSYGTSFRNPTLPDTYALTAINLAPGIKTTLMGSTGLKPEKIISYEAGYRKEIHSGFVGVNLFYNRATDLINFATTEVYAPPFPPGIPKTLTATNSNDAHAIGLEIESEIPLGKRVRSLFNYSYQDVQDTHGERIDLTPQHKLNIGITAQISSRIEGFIGAHLVGGSVLHSTATLVKLPTYTRFDARIGYRVGPPKHPWTLSLSATNLFDDKHIEYPVAVTGGTPASGVPQRRTIYFGISGKL